MENFDVIYIMCTGIFWRPQTESRDERTHKLDAKPKKCAHEEHTGAI